MKKHFKRANLRGCDYREAEAVSVCSNSQTMKIPETNAANCTKSLLVLL